MRFEWRCWRLFLVWNWTFFTVRKPWCGFTKWVLGPVIICRLFVYPAGYIDEDGEED